MNEVRQWCQKMSMMSCYKTSQMIVSSSLGLEVLLEDVVGRTLLAPVPDDTRGTFDHFPSLALAVDLAEAGPLAQLHVAVHLIRGMPCSMHRAEISFLYMGSSQFSARMQRRAWRLSRAFWVSLTPLARPSAMRACLRTSWMAVLISMGPEAEAALGTSSPSTSDILSSPM